MIAATSAKHCHQMFTRSDCDIVNNSDTGAPAELFPAEVKGNIDRQATVGQNRRIWPYD